MRLAPALLSRLGASVGTLAKRVMRGERPGTSAFHGLCDVIHYESVVGDGVVLLKDRFSVGGGALLGGFWFRGRDIECSSAEELAGVSQAVNNALKRLDTGWMLHVEAIRMPVHQYTPGEFLEPIDQLIDEEREERAHYYRTEVALFVTFAPSAAQALEKGLGKVLGDASEHELQGLEGRVDQFERKMSELEAALSSGFDEVARMRSTSENDELLQALNLTLNGSWQPVRSPRNPQYVDCLLARELVGKGDGLWYDELAVEVVGVQDLPAKSAPGFLHALTTLGVDFRWSSRFIVLDYGESRTRLKAFEGKWLQKMVPLSSQLLGTSGFADRDAQERVDEVQEALADLESQAVRYGHYTTVVVVRGATRAEALAKARLVRTELEKRGFVAVVESTLRVPAFLGSLPGHGTENVRRPMIHSLNYADMVPIGREWEGSRTCPSPQFPPQSPAHFQARTWGGSAFYGNLFRVPNDDVGHAILVGPTGAGKSTLVGLCVSQWMRYEGSQVFVFDQGGSITALTLARRDGAFYRLGLEGGPELCPLSEIDDAAERAWAESWLEGLCEAQGVALGTDERFRIREALKELTEETAGWSGAERAKRRTLTHLVPHLVDSRLQAALAYYTDGAGALLNGESDALRHARMTTFELEELLELDKKVVVPTLLYLFRQVERRLDGRPTLLVIDEAWRQLSEPVFADRLKAWLKKLRKKNCAVILATQQLSDVAKSPIGDVVFESCPTRFLLPNELATGSMRALYADCLGLTDQQIALLAQVERKRWYYYVAGTRSRLFTLDLGPTQIAFCGANSPEDLATIWKLLDQHGDRWPDEWLRLRGLPRAADRLGVLRSVCDERARARRKEP